MTPNQKLTYKVFSRNKRQQIQSEVSNVSLVMEEPDNRYFAIKVKKQNYLGKPTIAVYVSDATKKMRAKILQL